MKTLARLFAFFLIIPVIDLALLLRISQWIGFWWTVALIVGTALIGSYLSKREGLAVWRRLQDQLSAGGLPGRELLDGVIILIAGGLLIAPGVLTDTMGILGLFPPTRALIRKLAMRRIKKKMREGTLQTRFGIFGEAGWDEPGWDDHAPEDRAAPEGSAREETWQGTRGAAPRRTDDADPSEADATSNMERRRDQ